MSGGSYIQGYIGIAVADQKNQVIVSTEKQHYSAEDFKYHEGGKSGGA
jgi:hypothetical protein